MLPGEEKEWLARMEVDPEHEKAYEAKIKELTMTAEEQKEAAEQATKKKKSMYKTELLTMEKKFGNGCRMALTFSYAVTSSIWPKMFTKP